MLPLSFRRATARRSRTTDIRAQRQWPAPDVSSLVRRLAYFWIVWSGLLVVHELGHALAATWQGHVVRRVTVGAGPTLWRGDYRKSEGVLRIVPLVGFTTVREQAGNGADRSHDWERWRRELATIAGGVVATLAFALAMAALVSVRETFTGRRWMLARYVIADAVVLTVLNLLPVPPLDGGRALVGAVSAARGEPLSSEALFWLQAGGFALAVIPVMLWTRWTRPIDAAAARWGAPKGPQILS